MKRRPSRPSPDGPSRSAGGEAARPRRTTADASIERAAIEIVRPGLVTTVQDLGRIGLGRFGVSPSGALDRFALRLANRLLGNEDGAPALELTGPGAELAFLAPARFALAGGDLGARLDGVDLAPGDVIDAPAGARLAFMARVRGGGRAVVAFCGGLVVRRLLGSAATDLAAGLGGVEGRRLSRGARLALASAPRTKARVELAVDRAELAAVYGAMRLRYVPEGDPAVSADARARFEAGPLRVSERSNRTGFRLTAEEPLPAHATPERLSEGIAPGAIQLPPDGEPIVLLADRNTVGGYPRLGHLAAADEPRAAQLLPGDRIRFAPIGVGEAHAALRKLEALLPKPARGR